MLCVVKIVPIDVPFLFKLEARFRSFHCYHSMLCTLSWWPFVIRFDLIYFFFDSISFRKKDRKKKRPAFISKCEYIQMWCWWDESNYHKLNFICKWFVFRQIEHQKEEEGKKCVSKPPAIWLIVFAILFTKICLQTASFNHSTNDGDKMKSEIHE